MLFAPTILAALAELGISPHSSHADRMAPMIAKHLEREARAPAALEAAEAKRRRKAAKLGREIVRV